MKTLQDSNSIHYTFPVRLLNPAQRPPDGGHHSSGPPPATSAVLRGRRRRRRRGRSGRGGGRRAVPAQLAERVPARVCADRAGHEPRELALGPAVLCRQRRQRGSERQVSGD